MASASGWNKIISLLCSWTAGEEGRLGLAGMIVSYYFYASKKIEVLKTTGINI